MTETSIPTTPDTVYESIYVTTLADGQELRIPVHRKAGATSGPTLGIVALLHGDETLPNELVRLLLTQLDATELRGEVIALPASYPVALGALTRNSPIDMLDLNRSFPGDPAGWLTEQVAHALAEFLLPKIDVLVDLHSGGLLATVDYVYATHDARELAVAFGRQSTFLTASPHPGGLLGVAAARGVPAAILELGGGYYVEEQLIEPGVTAIENILKHLGMIGGTPSLAQEQTVFTELATLRPRAGGILHPGVRSDRLGTVIGPDELLGSVVSASSFEVLERFYSPFKDGRLVLLRPALGRINPGDFAYMIGNVATEERA